MRGSLDYYGASFTPAAGAGRFDVGSYNLSLLVGQKASTEYIRDEVGLDWAYKRIKRLGEYAHKLLSGMKGITVVTPEEHMAGLVAFTVDGIGPTDLKNRLLADHNVTIRDVNKYINNPDALRLATGFYNTEEDLDRMAAGIKAIQKSTLNVRRSAFDVRRGLAYFEHRTPNAELQRTDTCPCTHSSSISRSRC